MNVPHSQTKYRTPDGYTADIAIFTIVPIITKPYTPPIMDLQILLIQRSALNQEGLPNVEGEKWALAGGFISEHETGEEAALRELLEETGVSHIHLQHVMVADQVGRDSRGWIISNVYFAIVPHYLLKTMQAGDDAQDVKLFSVSQLETLDIAFDHREIINEAIKVVKKEMLQTTLAKRFLPELFTYSELQAVLATVTNDPAILSPQHFARKIKQLPFIEAVEGQTSTRTSKRKTQLYRFKDVPIHYSIYHMS